MKLYVSDSLTLEKIRLTMVLSKTIFVKIRKISKQIFVVETAFIEVAKNMFS